MDSTNVAIATTLEKPIDPDMASIDAGDTAEEAAAFDWGANSGSSTPEDDELSIDDEDEEFGDFLSAAMSDSQGSARSGRVSAGMTPPSKMISSKTASLGKLSAPDFEFEGEGEKGEDSQSNLRSWAKRCLFRPRFQVKTESQDITAADENDEDPEDEEIDATSYNKFHPLSSLFYRNRIPERVQPEKDSGVAKQEDEDLAVDAECVILSDEDEEDEDDDENEDEEEGPWTQTPDLGDNGLVKDNIWNANRLFAIEDSPETQFGEFTVSGSSAEEEEEEEEEVKVSEEAAVAAMKSLVQKFLELDRPRIEDKVASCLYIDEIMESYVEQITRASGESEDESMAYKPRDQTEDFIALKRSYNAMDLLCTQVPVTRRLLNSKMALIVSKLFDIFNHKSKGNFHHFRRLMESLMKHSSTPITDYVFADEDSIKESSKENSDGFSQRSFVMSSFRPPAVERVMSMIPYLYLEPVATVFLTMMFTAPNSPIHLHTRQIRFTALDRAGFLTKVVAQLEREDLKEVHGNYVDFLVRFIELAIKSEHSYLLFKSFLTNSSHVERLMNVISSNEASSTQKNACATFVHALLTKKNMPQTSIYLASTPEACAPPMNHLDELISLVRQNIRKNIPSLVSAILNRPDGGLQKYSAYTVTAGLTSARLTLIEILADVVGHDVVMAKAAGAPIDMKLANAFNGTTQFWEAAVQWFKKHQYNNMYQVAFYKMLYAAVQLKHEESLNCLLEESFINNLVGCLVREEQKGCKGMAILILNTMRFAAMDSVFIAQRLMDSASYQEGLELLRMETQRQIVVPPTIQYPNGYRTPAPQYTPLFSTFHMSGLLQKQFEELHKTDEKVNEIKATESDEIEWVPSRDGGFSVTSAWDIPEEEKEESPEEIAYTNGCDLGTKYSVTLGYLHPAPAVEADEDSMAATADPDSDSISGADSEAEVEEINGQLPEEIDEVEIYLETPRPEYLELVFM